MTARTFACAFAGALAGALGSGTAPAHAAPAGCSSAPSLASTVCVINSVRASHGLPRIRGTAILTRSATLRANAIIRCKQFSHTPCGQPFAAPFRAVGYTAARRYAIGENLAWMSGATTSPGQAVRMWLASPPHRRVLLSRGWRELGVVAIAAPGLFGQSVATVWVAQFGRRG